MERKKERNVYEKKSWKGEGGEKNRGEGKGGSNCVRAIKREKGKDNIGGHKGRSRLATGTRSRLWIRYSGKVNDIQRLRHPCQVVQLVKSKRATASVEDA